MTKLTKEVNDLQYFVAGAGFFGIPPEPARKGGGQPAAWSPGDQMRLGFILKFLEKCPPVSNF